MQANKMCVVNKESYTTGHKNTTSSSSIALHMLLKYKVFNHHI